MSLKDLNSDLYDPHSDIDSRHHETSRFDPLSVDEEETGGLEKLSEWKEKEKASAQSIIRKGKLIRLGLLGVLAAGVFIALFLIIISSRQSAFNEDGVAIDFSGTSEVESSQDAIFTVVIKNNNRVGLDNVRIDLRYPSNFQPIENQDLKVDGNEASTINVGSIDKKSEKTVTVMGKFFAPKDSTIYIRATTLYQPKGMSIEYQSEKQHPIIVRTAPIGIEVVGPYEASDGSDVFYTVSYENFGDLLFNNVAVKAEYPDTFSFIESDPQSAPGSNKSWSVGALEPHQKKEIKIRGTLSGERDTYKMFQFNVGIEIDGGPFVVYGEGEKSTKIVRSPLAVEMTLNGNKGVVPVRLGTNITYQIKFRNDGNIGVRDSIVTANIDSNLVDIQKSRLQGGFYDAAAKTITWKAERVPALAIMNPASQGELSFSIFVRTEAEVKNMIELSHEKNFIITASAKIDSPDIPIPVEKNRAVSSNVVEAKVGGEVMFDSKGYYFDNAYANTGPVPPRVGEETTFTMHWILSSFFTDLRQVKIETSLPTGVQWKGLVSAQGEDISFNPRTNSIVWNVGRIGAGSGLYSPSREIVFKVGVVPSMDKVGGLVALVNDGKITAEDEFTGEVYQIEFRKRTNQLPEDIQLGNRYNVIE